MKSIMKIGLGIVLGFVLLAVGCTALVGGAASTIDTDDKTFAEEQAEKRETRADTTEATTEATTETEKPEKKKAEPKLTAAQENAVAKAEQYLDLMAYSRTGLIDQLKFEKFSEQDATFGVDALKVNWNEQAVAKAEQYLDMMAYSRDGLIDQLKFEGFTEAQAAYGAKGAGL